MCVNRGVVIRADVRLIIFKLQNIRTSDYSREEGHLVRWNHKTDKMNVDNSLPTIMI